MLGAVMQDVTALAERPEISGAIVGRIVIEVSTGKDDAGDEERARPLVRRGKSLQHPPLPVAPDAKLPVPPTAIPEMQHLLAMRAAAALAAPARPAEADSLGEFSPVDRV